MSVKKTVKSRAARKVGAMSKLKKATAQRLTRKKVARARKRLPQRSRKSAGGEKRRVAPPPTAEAPKDFEELLVRDLVSSATGQKMGSGITAQDLILSLTASTRKLGYNLGFTVGRQIYGHGGANIGMFFDVLEKLGMGKVLYYPSEEHVIITSMLDTKQIAELNVGAHVFESGLIAGYFSGYLNRMVKARETLCIFKNSNVCQFVADTVHHHHAAEQNPRLDAVIGAIASGIDRTESSAGDRENRDYLLLPSLPLTKSPLLDEACKVLYLAGERLAVVGRSDYREEIGKMARYFDLEGANIHEAGGKRVIRLKYKDYNSLEGIVRLSSSMAMGYIAKSSGSRPVAVASVGRKGAYLVSIKA